MALGRLVLKNLKDKIGSNSSSLLSLSPSVYERSVSNNPSRYWDSQLFLLKCLSTAAGGEKSDARREVAVSGDESKRFKLFPRRQRRRGGLWRRNNHRDFPPAIWEIFPSGLGEALLQASNNMNMLFDRLNLNPASQLMGRYKEEKNCYKIRYNVPGLRKEDVKITVEDGYLTIKGEHKDEEDEGDDDDDDGWRSYYGYYDASLMLPDDAKADEIKAEMKNGVLTISIPRTELPKKDVKEIQVM